MTAKGLLAVVGGLLIFVCLFQSGAQAADPVPNEIVTENLLPGSPPPSGTSAGGRPEHPGLRDRHQRRPGPDGQLQDRHDCRRTTGSTSTARLVRGQRRPPGRHDPAVGRRYRRRPAGVPRSSTARRTTTSSTAATGASRRPGRCRPTPSPGSTSPGRTRRRRRRPRQPHRLHRARRRRRLADLLVQTSDTTWQAYNQYGGYSLYAGPRATPTRSATTGPFTTRATPDRGLAVQRRVPDGPLARAQRLRRQLLHRCRLRSPRRARSSSTRPSCRRATTSTGRPDSGQRRGRPRRRRRTSRSSAATRSTGRPAGSRAPPTAGAPTTARSSPTRKATPRAAEHYDCFGNFDCDPDPDTWTGLWRQNQTGHDGGRPENALSGQISWGDDTAAIQVPASDTGLRFWRNTGMQRRDHARPRTRSATSSTGSSRRTPAVPARPDHAVRYHAPAARTTG